MSWSTIQEHSPKLGGTFTLTIDGTPILVGGSANIPANTDGATLRAAFRAFTGLELTEVERNGNDEAGFEWIIYFIGFNQDVPELAGSGAFLTGGAIGMTPTVVVTTRRNYNSNLFVDPIDYRWMYSYASKPNVRVTVNGIPSACNIDCGYDFVSGVPKVTSATLSGYTLSLVLTDPAGLNANLTKVTVALDGQICKIVDLTQTMTSFSCLLPNNTDGTAKLRAGDHYPVVRIEPIGYAEIDAGVNPINVPLTIASVTNSTGGNNGGIVVTVTGTGYPDNSKDINFTLCSQLCTINSISNTYAEIVTPPCDTDGTTKIYATYNSLNADADYTYGIASTYTQIQSISPISWSPVMKGVMNITGTGFGNNKDDLKIFLTNSSGNIYKMKVLTANDTFIQAGIPGGLPGVFKVNVLKNGFGYANAINDTANQFTYEAVIDSIVPSTGSYFGGTLLTITGRNFVADVLDSMVTIGN